MNSRTSQVCGWGPKHFAHFVRMPSGNSQEHHQMQSQATAFTLAEPELVPASLHFVRALHRLFIALDKTWTFLIFPVHLSPTYLEDMPWVVNKTWFHVFILTAVHLGSLRSSVMPWDSCTLLFKDLTCFLSKMVESEEHILLQQGTFAPKAEMSILPVHSEGFQKHPREVKIFWLDPGFTDLQETAQITKTSVLFLAGRVWELGNELLGHRSVPATSSELVFCCCSSPYHTQRKHRNFYNN